MTCFREPRRYFATFVNFGPPSLHEREFHNYVLYRLPSFIIAILEGTRSHGSHVALRQSVLYTAVITATWKTSSPEIILTQYAFSLSLTLWARQIRFYYYLLSEILTARYVQILLRCVSHSRKTTRALIYLSGTESTFVKYALLKRKGEKKIAMMETDISLAQNRGASINTTYKMI